MIELDQTNIPKHVAIIMDGNGRWAKQKNKMRIFGHTNGVTAVRKAVAYARQIGVEVLTLYAFSSENWSRPEQEISTLMSLFMQALDREVKKLHKNNICLKIIGDVSRFSETLQEKIKKAENLTEKIPHLRSILRQITAVVGILFKQLNKLQKKLKKKKCQFQILITRRFNIILQRKMHHL
ncbi:UDP-3-O-[3-hydroxymyristoyl] glucosamine N-acyltransferase [Haemophilus influenzae R3021]|uniref:UDP-3-O-[3-hydroxymyristoyl] glucosamine N-acyltransferase n=1 Tax=Haemophilus influenzae R3021 TaxID=375432 RepID=A4N1K0_HAEIF|nr:UDP-3-O-[3-hydroxymyristoyl] glucosamine N-acyltransferase [Haemophilus influenzae R3021]